MLKEKVKDYAFYVLAIITTVIVFFGVASALSGCASYKVEHISSSVIDPGIRSGHYIWKTKFKLESVEGSYINFYVHKNVDLINPISIPTKVRVLCNYYERKKIVHKVITRLLTVPPNSALRVKFSKLMKVKSIKNIKVICKVKWEIDERE